jgi:RNA-binding protein
MPTEISMPPLTQSQKRLLKGKAHHLKPVVIMGQNGFTAAVSQEIDGALTAHELIKVRLVAGDHEKRQTAIDAIVQQNRAELVQRIGNIGVFFRRNHQKPKVSLIG